MPKKPMKNLLSYPLESLTLVIDRLTMRAFQQHFNLWRALDLVPKEADQQRNISTPKGQSWPCGISCPYKSLQGRSCPEQQVDCGTDVSRTHCWSQVDQQELVKDQTTGTQYMFI